MANETNNKAKTTRKTPTKPARKRNFLQWAGDKWAELSTPQKVVGGIAAGGAATAIGFGIKALLGGRRDDEDECEDEDTEDDFD